MQPVLELVPQLEARAHPSNAAPQYQRYEDIQILSRISALEVPSRKNRTLLESGSEGGRNTGAVSPVTSSVLPAPPDHRQQLMATPDEYAATAASQGS